MLAMSCSQTVASLSLGARQSPRGESEPPEPTFGALGMHERLNWLVRKNRSAKIARLRLMSAKVYSLRVTLLPAGQIPRSRSAHALCERNATFDGLKPKRSR